MASMSTSTMMIMDNIRDKGIQAKDKLIILDGKTYYYLSGSGNRADNVTLTINHVTYYFDNDGVGHILR